MRPHPFDLAFASLVDPHFAAIAAGAERDRRALDDLARFAGSSEVQHLLQDIEAPELLADSPDAGVEYLQALFAAFHFWRAGRHTLAADRSRLTAALDGPPPADLPAIPDGAAYLQLPDQWFWAQVAPGAPHEPVDGCFIVAAQDAWTVLAVLGLRADRSGFSQVALTAPGSDVLSAPALSRTPPFAPLMEGGATVGLRSVATLAELLHLVLVAAGVADRSGEPTGGDDGMRHEEDES